MYLSKEKIFSCMLSVEGYKNKLFATCALSKFNAKDNNIKIHGIGFNITDITVDELADKIIDGYVIIPGILNPVGIQDPDNPLNFYCTNNNGKTVPAYWKTGIYKGAFRNSIRMNKFVNKVQIIAIDIDDAANYKSIEEITDNLDFKPTFAYYSYSDTPDKRRIRMFYIFDKQFDYIDLLNNTEEQNSKNIYNYNQIVSALYFLFQHNTGLSVDNCGRKPEQIMNGTNHGDVWKSYLIYEESDFYNTIEHIKHNEQQLLAESLFKPNEIILWDEKLCQEINSKILFGGYKNSFDSMSELYSYFSNKEHKIYYRVETENWIESEKYPGIFWQFTEDNYFCLQYPTVKVPKGERRNFIFPRIRLRKLYNNNPNELLLNIAVDVKTFVDNADGKYNIDRLKAMVKKVSNESDTETKSKLPEYLFNKTNIIVKHISKNKLKELGLTITGITNTCIKESKLYIFKQIYNTELSEKENLKLINNSGKLKLTLRTLQRYKKECKLELSIVSKTDIEKLITDLLNKGLKQKEIIQKLKTEFNINVSDSTIKRIKKRILS